ncbi:hypothetical protein CTEN210_02769 [Chaetoceros tenuissimus]|uniref:Fungal lipase-type domain-containing protein n=1 Tax=Chaetoceros tenuissimus TaxID=426638 RepID=A0AAD3H0X1_9STRA|nr:hypothetical protein CTEN210_02769 [Chaetoceros tenuissimus]
MIQWLSLLLISNAAGFSPSLTRTQHNILPTHTHASAKTKATSSSTQLNLFSFKLNDLIKLKDKQEKEKEKEEKDPPQPTSSQQPLASIINVEALLMASGQMPNEEPTQETALLLDMLNINNTTVDTPTQPSVDSLLKFKTSDFFIHQLNTFYKTFTKQNTNQIQKTLTELVNQAEELAQRQGLDVSSLAGQARSTTKYTTELVSSLNGVLTQGYVGDSSLYQNYNSIARVKAESRNRIEYPSQMAKLSGAIYQNTLEECHAINHAIVQNGTTANVNWLITDSISYVGDFDGEGDEPSLTRTITLRGFDASDELVDREELLLDICNAEKIQLSNYPSIFVHAGLYQIAQEIYQEIKPYLENTAPNHAIVLNGHSIGGALSNLILICMTLDKGNLYVQQKLKRVYNFGSPPVLVNMAQAFEERKEDGEYYCSVLDGLGLPHDLVYAYVNPWDPIPRLFSPIDPLYPLIGDLGIDGVTLYANGPPRTLRPITKAILESWENWPRFRDENRAVMKQDYTHVGTIHLLMPDVGRYLTDRLVTVNLNAYEIDQVLKISSGELYDALEETFPLDVFSLSLVSTAIRSFIHHFFPAYAETFEAFAEKEKRKMNGDGVDKSGADNDNARVENESKKPEVFDITEQASKWILGDEWRKV